MFNVVTKFGVIKTTTVCLNKKDLRDCLYTLEREHRHYKVYQDGEYKTPESLGFSSCMYYWLLEKELLI